MELNADTALIPSARKEGETLFLVIKGEIDLYNSPDLRTALLDLIAKQVPKTLVLNLGQVPYMDSSAFAILVEVLRRVRQAGGTVCLAALQPRVQGLLEISRLGSLFTIVKDEADLVSN